LAAQHRGDAAFIRWSTRNVFLVGLMTIFVTLAGVYAVSRVPLDAIPDLSDVQVIGYVAILIVFTATSISAARYGALQTKPRPYSIGQLPR
jgi:hypothetical protein